jgi:hypothetical protein
VLIALLALVVGGVAGFLYASLRTPEPTTVPVIEVEEDLSPSPTEGGKRIGLGRNSRAGDVRGAGSEGSVAEEPAPSGGSVTAGAGNSGRSNGSEGSDGPGAPPAPLPQPAPAGIEDDDDDEPEDDGSGESEDDDADDSIDGDD